MNVFFRLLKGYRKAKQLINEKPHFEEKISLFEIVLRCFRDIRLIFMS